MIPAFAEVVLQHKAGRLDAARAGYEAILSAEPEHGGALRHLAALEVASGRLDRAAALYDAALRLHPADGTLLASYAALRLRLGDIEAAAGAARRAVEVQPRLAPAWLLFGRILSLAGQAGAAVVALRQAIDLAPNDAEAARELAVALSDSGDAAAALAAIARAVGLDPLDGEAAFHQGRLRHAVGDAAGAVEAYGRAHGLLGDVPEVLCNLGHALTDLGRAGDAVPLLRAALQRRPEFALAASNLGTALESLGRREAAIAAYRQALALEPGLTRAAFNLGLALARSDERQEGETWLRRSLELEPGLVQARIALGSLLTDANRLDEAAVQWQRAVELAPDTASHHAALGYVLIRLKRGRKALDAGERAIALDPESVDGYLVASQALRVMSREEDAREVRARGERMVEARLADTVRRCGDLTAIAGQCFHAGDFRTAARLYRRVLQLDPERHEIRARLLDATLSLCDWSDYDGFVAELRQRLDREIAADGPRLDVFNLLALPIDNIRLFAAAKAKARAMAELAGAGPALGAPTPIGAPRPERLKVGFTLPYTYFHSMPMVMKAILDRLDRQRFAAVGYAVQKCDGTTFSRHFRAAFDAVRDLPLERPGEGAAIIAADRPDILIDTTGHTGITCLPILAHRPAAVQAHYLGYGLTSGADYVDYLITDQRFLPPAWARYCSERLVYLPDSFMATVHAQAATKRPTRAEEGLPEQGLVLANFNHPCKLEPRMFGLWLSLLQRIPDAVLWLGGWAHATRDSLKAYAAARGLAPERLVFARILPHAQHMSRLGLADLALDNLHHGGGVTSVDALWAGLPLLTVKGATPAGRLGHSLSHAAGQTELVTDSLEAYEATALALAADRPRLARLKAALADVARTPLFDGARYVRHLEAAFDLMWDRRGESRDAPPLVI